MFILALALISSEAVSFRIRFHQSILEENHDDPCWALLLGMVCRIKRMAPHQEFLRRQQSSQVTLCHHHVQLWLHQPAVQPYCQIALPPSWCITPLTCYKKLRWSLLSKFASINHFSTVSDRWSMCDEPEIHFFHDWSAIWFYIWNTSKLDRAKMEHDLLAKYIIREGVQQKH